MRVIAGRIDALDKPSLRQREGPSRSVIDRPSVPVKNVGFAVACSSGRYDGTDGVVIAVALSLG